MKPMLAATMRDYDDVPGYPLLVTPKVDGVRALIVDGVLVSRSLKPIPNVGIRAILEGVLPEGADGELVVNNTFHETTSVVMSRDGPTDTFVYYWFDVVIENVSYAKRITFIKKLYANMRETSAAKQVVPLIPRIARNRTQLEMYEAAVIREGFEGVVARIPRGPYKFGRSTLSEGYMIKIKHFEDCEGIVVGTEELMHNANEARNDALGYAKRSTRKEGMIPSGKLGALVVNTWEPPTPFVTGHSGLLKFAGCAKLADDTIFKLGTGFTDEQRCDLWRLRDETVGQLVKFKYFGYGVKNAPRCPVFVGFRDIKDLGAPAASLPPS